ncbi:MAG: YebC/PmpR family DNA-binding transcriptional regulator, partial [Lachnospiraceae bacterium]|nr:YebC/PmpR family DNA-binding transcriptional regulator [Lachnospiraceae bacterium]
KEEIDLDPDELMMLAVEAGAEDFDDEEDSYEIITAPEDFSAVLEAIQAADLPIVSADVTMIPQTWVELSDEQDRKNINRILDLLNDDDDVQNVYHNWDE